MWRVEVPGSWNRLGPKSSTNPQSDTDLATAWLRATAAKGSKRHPRGAVIAPEQQVQREPKESASTPETPNTKKTSAVQPETGEAIVA